MIVNILFIQMLTDAEGDRADVTDILILFTDGEASDPQKQLEEANLLKQNGVKIISVGFGSFIDLDSLNKTASPSCKGTGKKLLFQADFKELDSITNAIAQEACNCA